LSNILPEFPLIFFIFVLGMKKMIHLLWLPNIFDQDLMSNLDWIR
jgi:hypothetical protein